MGHVFVSYSRSDADVADRLSDRLEAAGYEVWIDREGIPGGTQWRQQIVRAIKKCDYFIILLSGDSIRSENVRKELDIADNTKKRILPVDISPVAIPDEMEYQLAGVHRIDLATDFDTGYRKLLSALGGKRVMSHPPKHSAQSIPTTTSVGLTQEHKLAGTWTTQDDVSFKWLITFMDDGRFSQSISLVSATPTSISLVSATPTWRIAPPSRDLASILPGPVNSLETEGTYSVDFSVKPADLKLGKVSFILEFINRNTIRMEPYFQERPTEFGKSFNFVLTRVD
jgi:hypothetical protein